jgi:hypothetical protein
VLPKSEQDAKGWLFELGDAGVDDALLAKARARVKADSDDIEPFERDGVRVRVVRSTRRVTGHPLLGWGISAEIAR